MPEMNETIARLQAAFTHIHETRMNGVPILNSRLKVECAGTREWNDHWLTVLITPWFINLMLLARSSEQSSAWSTLSIGSKMLQRFPAGRFEFIVGEESDLGRYLMCSLFSPVLEFEDQEAAQIAANAALDTLFNADIDDPAPGPEQSSEKEAIDGSQPTRPSRRGLFFGRLASDEGAN